MRYEIYGELVRALREDELVVLATVVAGPGTGNQLLTRPRGETVGDLGAPRLNRLAALHAEQILPEGRSGRQAFHLDQEVVDVFFEVFWPAPQLIVVGGVHIAVELVRLARGVGFRTVVIDPRSAFLTRERFPDADELLALWPQQAFERIELHEGSYVAVLSHDLKIDVPALATALASRARYIGALGSQKTHEKRLRALEELGLDRAATARIRSPIGLDLGGRRAEEIAVAILAELIAVRNGRSGLRRGSDSA